MMNNPNETVRCEECGEPTVGGGPACNLCIADHGLFAPPPMINPDDTAVDQFANAMKFKMKLSAAKGRGGWDDPEQCSVEDLNRMMMEHLYKGDPVDIANFCMMLHHRGAKIEMPPCVAVNQTTSIDIGDEDIDDLVHLGFAYKMMVESHHKGLVVNFLTGDISLPKNKKP